MPSGATPHCAAVIRRGYALAAAASAAGLHAATALASVPPAVPLGRSEPSNELYGLVQLADVNGGRLQLAHG